ncbi:DMT family transporter [Desulfobulbus sp.]|uniref:DMT family transporter n=1 Tax=Desulfobulbus sp. TaxID=895 RepID=UPI0027B8F6AF|nr:DMT family transporter [Desulfobulbus sp.]
MRLLANGAHRAPSLGLLHGAMLLSAFLVSTSFTVGKAITPFMDPAALTLIRFLLATLLFAPYVRRTFGLSFPGVAALLRYSLISAALVGFFWLMFQSLRITNPLNTGVIFTTVPGISGLYSWFLLRERLGGYRIAALILAMVGALWVIFEGDMDRLLRMQLNSGDLLFFGGCLLMALYMPLVKLLHRGEPMAVMTLWVLVTGSAWLLLLAAVKLPSVPWTAIPAKVWLGIAYLALFTTIVTFFISQWATLHLGPTRVMAYSYLYPPLIVLIEWVLHRSLPHLASLVGIVIILPAMFIVQRGKTISSPTVNTH